MNTLSLKLDEETIARLTQAFRDDIKENPNPYVRCFIQNEDVTITVYTSGKVVFQGKDANIYASAYLTRRYHDEAGSDEVGTGDYFGPVCVCACIVTAEMHTWLDSLQINDSKELRDEQIKETAPKLMEKIPYSLLILKPKKYNEVAQTNNMNEIKAKMHNQAYVNLLHKGYTLPKATYVDQFAEENLYYRYLINEKEVIHDLIFETKAESSHPAVACASMIARYAFLREMEAMEAFYGIKLHKGGGEQADLSALNFVRRFGMNRLNEVAKLHFKNTEKVKELLEQSSSK